MAEIFGAAAAAAGLLEAAVRLIKWARKANERQKNLVEFLDLHLSSVESLNDIVRAIVDEDALQTESVAFELKKIQATGAKLVKCLKELDPGGKGRARQLGRHMLRGSQDEETLADILAELERAKTSLILRVQLAGVGLTRRVHDDVLAEAEVLQRMDQLLIRNFGDTPDDLKLAGLAKDHIPQRGDAAWQMSAPAARETEAIDNFVGGNTAKDSAVQLLAPVGVNLQEDARTWIEGNRASGQAIQIASSTDLATLKYLLENRARTASSQARRH